MNEVLKDAIDYANRQEVAVDIRHFLAKAYIDGVMSQKEIEGNFVFDVNNVSFAEMPATCYECPFRCTLLYDKYCSARKVYIEEEDAVIPSECNEAFLMASTLGVSWLIDSPNKMDLMLNFEAIDRADEQELIDFGNQLKSK